MKAAKENNNLYNKNLRNVSHKLRYTMTKAEACLWKYVLSNRQMNGYAFNRQRAVLDFVADFICKELKLVIEVDGYSHQFDETKKKDKHKQAELENAGFTVIRFTDNEVLKHMTQVRQAIWDKIEELKVLPLPPP